MWEDGASQHPLDRALTILGAIYPHLGRGELAALSVGTRDALLLSLHERTFGSELRAVTPCPSCGENLEIDTATHRLRAAPPLDGPPAASAMYAFEHDGVGLRFRLVDSQDLAAILTCSDPSEARRVLVRRVVIAAQRGAEALALDERLHEIPEAILAALEARIAELDPQAEVLLDLTCPACATCWTAPFDVITFVWTEVEAHARRLLRTVDALARVYGWREADVLALSPRRRNLYLELARA